MAEVRVVTGKPLKKKLGSHKVFKEWYGNESRNYELMANTMENSSRQMTSHRKNKKQNVVFHESTRSL